MDNSLFGRCGTEDALVKKEVIWHVLPLSAQEIVELDKSEPDWKERVDRLDFDGIWYIPLYPEGSEGLIPKSAIRVVVSQKVNNAKGVYRLYHAEIIGIIEKV